MTARSDTVRGANAGRSRSHNRRVVLDKVRDAGKIGRAEIARATGLSTQAVSNIIAELVADGLLVEDGRRSAGRGLPALLYALNPKGGFALGVEIRPDALLISVLDLAGQELCALRETLDTTSPDWVCTRIRDLRDTALRSARVPAQKLLGAGVVLPGPFGTTGLSDSASELPEWQQLDVASWLAERLDLPVMVENDANAAAMAERVAGVARELHTYAYLYFGAGLGLGLVQDRRLMRGAFGNAGEIGHAMVPGPDGAVVLEHAVSRVAAQKHLARRGVHATTGGQLETLYREANPHLRQWLDRAAEPFSHAVAMIENLLDPQTIILGGAMPEGILDHLIDSVTLSEHSVSNRADRNVPRLLRGRSGPMTAARGAAALVINQRFTPQIPAGH
ncbi:putative NBD/HSP70 family sugar kinase [Aliiruegeria haliotis]|uniref:Putative NBD/HSP70 family sugar kinase n=1 Tax=Aliiruegeria haliotis TaxID=1280846 RepID=A0A2T0RYA3_9RHOB|nr:ROK family transcriptional regulator [Aliiruegeria haliotis]PRY26164.1 putative NBD/HSP70 family sugar kinase [Aliiruegeria haliotis]